MVLRLAVIALCALVLWGMYQAAVTIDWRLLHDHPEVLLKLVPTLLLGILIWPLQYWLSRFTLAIAEKHSKDPPDS